MVGYGARMAPCQQPPPEQSAPNPLYLAIRTTERLRGVGVKPRISGNRQKRMTVNNAKRAKAD